MMGRSETGWILAAVALLVVIVIGLLVWTRADTEPETVPADSSMETFDTDTPSGSLDVDGTMDMTLPPPEEGEYQGIGEPPA